MTATFGFQWHLTDRCNLRCAHCYQERFDHSSEQSVQLAIRAAERIFAALQDRPLSINLTGGEPLLLPWLPDLLQHLHRYTNLSEVSIITNGTLPADSLLSQRHLFPLLTTIKLSLEAADPARNDALRGAGTLAKVLAHLPRWREAGLQTVFMVTLSRANLDQIIPLVHLAAENRVDGIIFERFVPLGQGVGMREMLLRPQDWTQAVTDIAAAADLDVDPLDLLPFTAFWLGTAPCVHEDDPRRDAHIDESTPPDETDDARLRGALCNLGDESMALMPDGTVYPCRRLPIPIGNVQGQPFEVILQQLEAWHPDRTVGRLKGPLCGHCRVEGCAGCRAMAHAVYGDPYADDPTCPLRCFPA